MSTLRTWTGSKAPIEDGEGEINIIDLVVHLGRTARFGGYGDPNWTVLHHSVLVCLIAMRLQYGLLTVVYALLHDFHEAYTGDIPSPIKRRLRQGEVDQVGLLESFLDSRIFAYLFFKLPLAKAKKDVKHCDRIALVLEALLFGPVGCDLYETVPEDERADVAADLERVAPNYQKYVRRMK